MTTHGRGLPRRHAVDVVVQEMLASIALPDEDVARRVMRARDVRYWRRLVPELSIGGRGARPPRTKRIDETRAVGDLSRLGYAHLGPVFDRDVVRRMARAVERLRAHDWPTVFAFLFDEFWRAPRSGQIPAMLRASLGSACVQSPNVWLHTVPASPGAAGWPPHRDHADANRLTMWIPLTPAGVEDGCMFVLPVNLLPPHLAGSWESIDTMTREDVLRLLHAARPLPAQPGSVLCWRTNVLHWGGYRTTGTQPRIAFSMEFSGAVDDGALPLAGPLPPFARRLQIVANMVLLYQRQEPRAARYLELARALS